VACLNDDQAKLREHGGVQLVADAGGAVVGYLCCAITQGPPYLREEVRMYAYVETLVVAASARGTGLGERLMREAEAFARGQGLRSLAVGHLAGNDGAGRLYDKLGLAPHAIERIKWLE
jgi:GNAT superfamily N-acetyltransferase